MTENETRSNSVERNLLADEIALTRAMVPGAVFALYNVFSIGWKHNREENTEVA